MSLRPNILQTGSAGNCVLLNDELALDIGVVYKKIAPYAKDLRLVHITHEHGDHLRPATVRALARLRPTLRFSCGAWLTSRLLAAGVQARNIDVMEPGNWYDYGAFSVSPVPLHHNVDNYGLRIQSGGERAIYIVDTGYVDDVEAVGYDLYMIEANHTEADIAARIEAKHAQGVFAYESEAAKNHLSREQAETWLAENARENSRYVFLHVHTERANKRNRDGEKCSTTL